MLPQGQQEPKVVTRTYKPFSPEFFGRVEETSDEERTTHEGSCHCGAIAVSTFLLLTMYPTRNCIELV